MNVYSAIMKYWFLLDLKIFYAQKRYSSYLVSHYYSSKSDLGECDWCSIWSPHSRTTACNTLSKFSQPFLISPWLEVLIAVVILRLNWVQLGKAVRFTWSSTNLQKSSEARLSGFAGQPVGPCVPISELRNMSSKTEWIAGLKWG